MPAEQTATAPLVEHVPADTLRWLLEPEIPQVAVLTRRGLLGERDDSETAALWERRNEYAPVSAILDAMREDGCWDVPSRDYQKYRGSLWQIHLLGELYANGSDPRVARGAEYAFSRQLTDGSWSATNMRPPGSITCLTANVGRALARMGWARDERVIAGLRYCVDVFDELGCIDCRPARLTHLIGYCHMLTPKLLMFLAEVPRELWPDGAEAMRDECVLQLRDKEVFKTLPNEFKEYNERMWELPAKDRPAFRDRFMAEPGHEELHLGPKPGWLRFGYPLSYNSDVLEALWALAAVGEPRREEYEAALQVVESAADDRMRWALRNTLNGKMYADVEKKGQPSKWLTLRALSVLAHFGG